MRSCRRHCFMPCRIPGTRCRSAHWERLGLSGSLLGDAANQFYGGSSMNPVTLAVAAAMATGCYFNPVETLCPERDRRRWTLQASPSMRRTTKTLALALRPSKRPATLLKSVVRTQTRQEPAWSHFSGILLLAFAQLTRKPRLGQVPVGLHRGAGNSQYCGSFVNAQAAEKPHLDKLGLLRIEFGEAAESLIQCDDICGFPLGNSSRFFQKYFLKAVAALLRVMAAAVVDQNTPH